VMAAAPADTVGILGGGQLGRMLVLAAARLGLKAHIFAPEADSPAFDVAAFKTIAAYDDRAALAQFAAQVQVVTYEFENVPAATAAYLSSLRPVYPDAEALAVTQDRLSEKAFVSGLGICTAPYVVVDDAGGLARAVAQIGRPAILKTRRFGYDGKGQAVIREGSDLAAVFRSLGPAPCILEGIVPFVREVSVVAARGVDGSFAAYDVCENEHVQHVLSRSKVPAMLSAAAAAQAVAIAQRIAAALNYVGVMTVEMFVVDEPEVGPFVNEIAPRVHNSGHWTLDGAVTSQFEQHIRAVCGWPLGSTRRHGEIEMRNLLGGDVSQWRDLLAIEGACVHLYGKRDVRPGRKMGHVTFVRPENPPVLTLNSGQN
jgi:5-(carboxyamino)imidazole ribonucleotide synthase